jgi:transcriptional regulator with XRE-family HTH domain
MFTENLKRRRLAEGMTQEWIAGLLNIAQSTYAQIERGTKQPSIPIIKDMVKIFCCTADELLFGEGAAEGAAGRGPIGGDGE